MGPLRLLLCIAVACLSGKATAADTLLLYSVPAGLEAETTDAIKTHFLPNVSAEVYELKRFQQKQATNAAASTIVSNKKLLIGAGKEACLYLSRLSIKTSVVCTSLFSVDFVSIANPAKHKIMAALVLDQPASRQARVANQLFPSLASFTLMASDRMPIEANYGDSITLVRFDPNRPFIDQLTSTLATSDALIAVADLNLYAAAQFQTVLQTAYGHGKPVVGYSENTVRAGALVSTNSNQEQLFRQLGEIVAGMRKGGYQLRPVIVRPKYFSIFINTNNAKSLNLAPKQVPDPRQTFTDSDVLG